MALQGLGRIYTGLRRFEEAVDCLQEALAIQREMGDRYSEAWSLEALGFSLQHGQGMDAARACWQEALTIFTELGSRQEKNIRIRLGGEGIAKVSQQPTQVDFL
jgi:tetratricopeptide (TPR) repeat protein